MTVGLSVRAAHLSHLGSWELDVAEVVADAWLWASPDELRPLERLRRDVPLHLHALGLNLGSVDGLDPEYVDRLRTLADRLEVDTVSDHFAWRSVDGEWSSTFFPIPLLPDSLAHVATRVEAVQARLGRPLALETPTLYVSGPEPAFDLADALLALHARCECPVLVDACNLRVSARNVGLDAEGLARRLAPITAYTHVAGFARGRDFWLDDHGSAPESETLRIARLTGAPMVLEWDRQPPPPERIPEVLERLWRSDADLRPSEEADAPPAYPSPPEMPRFGDDYPGWCRAFRRAVAEGESVGFKALRAEQIYGALGILEANYPVTQRALGEGFRGLVREHVARGWARDVHGLDWILTFADFLRARPELEDHPQRAALEAEWSRRG
ncbi:MAG: DUF692 family multinuclear iron-containing protein [Myxococcota bacterium]